MITALPIDDFIKVVRDAGFEDLANNFDTINFIKEMVFHHDMMGPDFDSTYLNLEFGSKLSLLKNRIPEAFNYWSRINPLFKSDNSIDDMPVVKAVKKYAYRQNSPNRAINTINPGSYFWLREFFDAAHDNHQDLALFTTFIQDLDEQAVMGPKGEALPNRVNDIDVIVGEMILMSTTNSILSGLLSPS